MAGSNPGAGSYYVPDQSRLAISMATSVALLVIGVAGGINSITFDTGHGGFWTIFQLGLVGFVVTLALWFRQTIKENRAA